VLTGFTFNRSERGIQTSGKPGAPSAAKGSPPNVIIILADDLGCGGIDCGTGLIGRAFDKSGCPLDVLLLQPFKKLAIIKKSIARIIN
jgi:hypothetical protein